jgi:hypothetical protein
MEKNKNIPALWLEMLSIRVEFDILCGISSMAKGKQEKSEHGREIYHEKDKKESNCKKDILPGGCSNVYSSGCFWKNTAGAGCIYSMDKSKWRFC